MFGSSIQFGGGGGAEAGAAATLYKSQSASDPVDGVTGAGTVERGELHLNQTTGNVFRNIGTKAAPVWAGWIST